MTDDDREQQAAVSESLHEAGEWRSQEEIAAIFSHTEMDPQTQTALVVSTGLYCLAQVLVEHPVGEREAVAKVFWARLPECVGRLERNRVKETDDNQEPSTNG